MSRSTARTFEKKKEPREALSLAAAAASVAHFLKKPFCCSVIIACCFVLPMYVVVEYRHVYKIMNLSGRPGESNRGHDCDFVCPSWHGSVIQKQRRLYMQPGSRCCMSSRFRWRRKIERKKIWKDTTYNGISEYSSERFVIIKGHLLVCFFCTNGSGAFFCSLLFWCRPHVIILNTSSYVYVPLGTHSLSLDTCIYILKVCLNWTIILIEFGPLFCLGYTIAWVMASGDSTGQ